MRDRVLPVIGTILIVLLVALALRSAPGPQQASTAQQGPQGVPSPPRIAPYPPPTSLPIVGTPSHPFQTPVPPGYAGLPTSTPTPFPPTPTFTHRQVTPIVVPSKYPTPAALPSGLPRQDPIIFSEDWNSIAQDTQLAAVVALVTVQEIDAPIYRNPSGAMPSGPITLDNVLTPATLRVLHMYKGPALSTIQAAYGGACFSPRECTTHSAPYFWTDLVGYRVMMFFNQAYSTDRYFHGYYPFRAYIVTPGQDDVLDVRSTLTRHLKLSQLVSEVEAATGTSH